jgi:CubicO group peptidase (beta-lactamase class C family)
LLELDGKLSVDDDIRKYIPELHDFGETITIRHLINHTSGLRDQWELLITAGWRMEDVITTQDVLDLVFQQRELNFKPSAEYSHCNTGYTLLGIIVKNVTGKTLREFCDARIFQPLGMTNTHFHDDHREIVPNRAYSYGETEDGYQHLHLLYATVGATSLFTTVGDLLRWEANFFDPQVGGAKFIDKLLQQGILNDGETISYAFGVTVHDYRGVRCVDHSGGDAGYRTHLLHFPEQKFAVTVLSNLASFTPGKLAFQIADIFLAEHFTNEPVTPTVTLPTEQLKAFEGTYYSAASASSLSVTFDEEQGALLFWRQFALEALDETHFRLEISPPSTLHFVPAQGETPMQLVMDNPNGRPSIYEKVDAEAPSAEALAAYVGRYFCPELSVQYEILVEEGALALRRRKYGTAGLLPTIVEGFREANGSYDLLFTRGDAGEITGFAHTSGRNRHLRFERQS